jgi:hypothetical protein
VQTEGDFLANQVQDAATKFKQSSYADRIASMKKRMDSSSTNNQSMSDLERRAQKMETEANIKQLQEEYHHSVVEMKELLTQAESRIPSILQVCHFLCSIFILHSFVLCL